MDKSNAGVARKFIFASRKPKKAAVNQLAPVLVPRVVIGGSKGTGSSGTRSMAPSIPATLIISLRKPKPV